MHNLAEKQGTFTKSFVVYIFEIIMCSHYDA